MEDKLKALEFLKDNLDFYFEEQFGSYYFICQNKMVVISEETYNLLKEVLK